MTKDQKDKKDWKTFFSFEKSLLKYLSERKILSGNKDDLAYIEVPFKNTVLERPPKFLHAIISLQDDVEAIARVEADIEKLKSLYEAVSDKKPFPSRFPQLLNPNPLQINLSQHEAFRSYVVPSLKKPDFIQIKRYGDQIDLADDDLAALDKIGIKAVVSDSKFGRALTVSINDLINYANKENMATKLTVRELSGTQYTARVRYPESFTSVRMSYSLLIVRSDCTVVDSLPQGRRAHRLETTKDKLKLPIELETEIFIKEH